MRITTIVTLACWTIALSGCKSLDTMPASSIATGLLRLANGAPAGSVVVAAAGDNATITVVAAGLAPGTHGLHLHSAGNCEAPAFVSAGGHLNPRSMQHGTANPAGSHLGDLPNLTADSSGAGTITAVLRGSRSAVQDALFDADGTAVIIHAGPDDYKTDPAGNSGTRIACGVLTRG